eukprot:scaffold68732_cov53-Phaeocystis_antarctica.AAC.1
MALLHYIAALHSSNEPGQKGPGSSLLRGRPQPRGNKTRTDIYNTAPKSSVTSAPSPNLRTEALSPSAVAACLVLLCLAARALPPARTSSPRPCTCPTSRGR